MAIIRFTEGGKEFPLSHKLLMALAQNCTDGPLGAELGRALLSLGIPSLTEELVDKDFLTAAERDAIWENGDLDVRRRLLREEAFLSRLTDAQAREIVAQDDVEMLETVGEWSERLYPGREGGLRISGAVADMLIDHIRTHENASVRAALAENSWTPPRFYPPLEEYVRNGYRLRSYPFAALKVEEVDLLRGLSREVLKELAFRVGDIGETEARQAAVTMLAAHPDPDVRQALAENEGAPRLAHELLARDTDPEIAALAAQRLKNI
ncbi:MAG: hypothetical protein HDQ94_00820 [Desulfovibrio sp.]|nr:hypothetical protein [Desulfovibrio sp.]